MNKTCPYPIARIGLIGGGQLGRMLVKAAKPLGCTSVVLDPVKNSPAGTASAWPAEPHSSMQRSISARITS